MTYYFFGRQRGELTGISVCSGGSRIRCEVWQLVSVGRVNVAGSELNSETFKYVAAWIEVAVWYEPFCMTAERYLMLWISQILNPETTREVAGASCSDMPPQRGRQRHGQLSFAWHTSNEA